MGRCWGLNRNLRRCGRVIEAEHFCHDHRRQPLIWASFLLFTVLAGSASIYSALRPSKEHNIIVSPTITDNHTTSSAKNMVSTGTNNTQKKNIIPSRIKNNNDVIPVQPELISVLDKHPVNKGFLLFTLKNEGLVDAKSVHVDQLTMRYLYKNNKIKLVTGGSGDVLHYDEPGHNWLFVPELKSNMTVSKLTGESVFPDNNISIDILYFRIRYLDSNMAYREKESIFFAEGNQLYSYNEYKSHKIFPVIDFEIKRALSEIVARFHTLGTHKKQ